MKKFNSAKKKKKKKKLDKCHVRKSGSDWLRLSSYCGYKKKKKKKKKSQTEDNVISLRSFHSVRIKKKKFISLT